MAVHMVLRRPVAAPAPQLRVVWQGCRSGDTLEARWTDGSGQGNRWSGSRGLAWLQRDALRDGEEWKVNLAGVPADVRSISLMMSSSVARTVGAMVQPLSGDPNAAVLHPGAQLSAGSATELLEFHRSGGDWEVVALNTSVGEPDAPDFRPGPAPAPDPRFAGWSGPVSDGPAAGRPGGEPVRPAPVGQAPSRWTDHAAPPDHVDDGPRVTVPDRLTDAVDAARSTGKVRRARVSAVVDLSASMYPWITSGAVADVLTAVQAVAGAAQRPGVSTRFLPDGADVELPLEAEPRAALQAHLRAVGLRTGDRGLLAHALAGAGSGSPDTVTLMVTDDPSLADEPAAAGSTAVVLGGDTRPLPGESGAAAIFLPPGPVDVNRLARDLADRCFTTARR